MGKHATAVFSGKVPDLIGFLEPEKTIEKNTDGLRDFIISLDKSKADKLRYKVEDKVVKIFITPYRTSISEKDLEFSQGDINVDVVIALGVHEQRELDQAITAHGRILHDAVIVSINNTSHPTNLGTINWQDTTITSLSEMVTLLSTDLGGKELFDSQNATALLTGIVAVTKRFSNQLTSAQAMSASALLLSVGANQQLVATKLEPPPPPPPAPLPPPPPPPKPKKPPKEEEEVIENTPTEGTLTIEHTDKKEDEKEKDTENEDDNNELSDEGLTEQERLEQIRIDDKGTLHHLEIINAPSGTPAGAPTEPGAGISDPTKLGPPNLSKDASHFMSQPPSSLAAAGGPVNSESDMDVPSTPDLEGEGNLNVSAPQQPILTHENSSMSGAQRKDETLAQIEKDVNSPHINQDGSVTPADNSTLQPIQALGAQPLGSPLHADDSSSLASALPSSLSSALGPVASPTGSPSLAPPVPPPMIPPIMPSDENQTR